MQALKDKRLGVIVGVWLGGNMVQNALTQTGAFEVFYDGQLVPTPLSTTPPFLPHGRPPAPGLWECSLMRHTGLACALRTPCEIRCRPRPT